MRQWHKIRVPSENGGAIGLFQKCPATICKAKWIFGLIDQKTPSRPLRKPEGIIGKNVQKTSYLYCFLYQGDQTQGISEKKVSAFCCIYLINLRSSNNYIQLPSHFQGRKEISIGNLKSGSRFLKIKLFKSFEEAGGFVYKIYMMTCEMWEVKNL